MVRLNIVALLINMGSVAVNAQSVRRQGRQLFESPKNFKENPDNLLDKILDEGEDEPGHRGHKHNKKKTAEALAAHAEKKEFGEHVVKVNVKAIEETPYDAPLDDKKEGKVDKVLEEAKVEATEELKAKKDVKKEAKKKKKTTEAVKKAAAKFEVEAEEKNMLKQAEVAGGMAAVEAEAEAAAAAQSGSGGGGKSKKEKAAKVKSEELVLKECDTVKQQVAFLVPTSEAQMERSLAMLISFERMGYGPYGDIKFIFQSEDTVEAFASAIPNTLKKWNVTDTNPHRLMVELKENAIIHGPNQMPSLTREMAMEDGEGSARFLKSCKRLFALAHILDTSPCAFKYAVFATPEGRFLPPKEEKASKGLLGAFKGGKKKTAPTEGTAASANKKKGGGKGPLASAAAVVQESNVGNLRSRIRRRDLLGLGAQVAEERKGGGDGEAKKPKKERKPKPIMAGKTQVAQVPDVEEAKAGTGVAAAEALAKEASERMNLVARLDVLASSRIVWGHNCNSSTGVGPGVAAARKRMETNAFVFAGGKTTSPRYQKILKNTNNFDLFTLQSVMPVIELKTKAAKFLLEMFRASGANPESAGDLRSLMSAAIDKLPPNKAADFSDVLMYQFYEIVRGGHTVRDASAQVPLLPSCSEAAPLLDALGKITAKEVMTNYIKKIGPPLLVPKGFSAKGAKGLAPLLEYERPPGDYTDGESIF